MSISFDVAHLREFGWVRINGAVPVKLCHRLLNVLETDLGVPINDPSRWDAYGGEPRDFVPIWGHQAQWDIRQHPNLHHIWATLYGTERLFVSLDSCRFTPPWKPGHAEPYGTFASQHSEDRDPNSPTRTTRRRSVRSPCCERSRTSQRLFASLAANRNVLTIFSSALVQRSRPRWAKQRASS